MTEDTVFNHEGLHSTFMNTEEYTESLEEWLSVTYAHMSAIDMDTATEDYRDSHFYRRAFFEWYGDYDHSRCPTVVSRYRFQRFDDMDGAYEDIGIAVFDVVDTCPHDVVRTGKLHAMPVGDDMTVTQHRIMELLESSPVDSEIAWKMIRHLLYNVIMPDDPTGQGYRVIRDDGTSLLVCQE